MKSTFDGLNYTELVKNELRKSSLSNISRITLIGSSASENSMSNIQRHPNFTIPFKFPQLENKTEKFLLSREHVPLYESVEKSNSLLIKSFSNQLDQFDSKLLNEEDRQCSKFNIRTISTRNPSLIIKTPIDNFNLNEKFRFVLHMQ